MNVKLPKALMAAGVILAVASAATLAAQPPTNSTSPLRLKSNSSDGLVGS